MRVEKKYLCSDYDILLLQQRLAAALTLDPHQQGNAYGVRSVYFDTPENECYYENESGTDDRKKYRIRIYSLQDDVIKFEIKHKKQEKCWKDTIALTRQECEQILNGRKCRNEQVSFLLQKKRLSPVIIVDYERTAYVYPLGNVRITFDRNIAASYQCEKFFGAQLGKIPLLAEHMHLMEVKYDEFLPDFIVQLLDIGNLSRVTFSKYYLARQKLEF